MTSERLLNMSIKFYTSPKNFLPPPPKKKQISGYAPVTWDSYHTPDDDHFWTETFVNVVELQDSEIEHDQVDSVDVSCTDERLITGQREPQYDRQ